MLSNKFTKGLVIMGTSVIAGTVLFTTFNNVQKVHADTVWIAKTPNEIGNLNSNGTYTVQEGDTIWAIGMHFNIKPSVIENVNAINNPYDLQIGTILKLHVYDHGKKATFLLQNGNQKVETKLNNSDKLDQHESFGKAVKQNKITASIKSSLTTTKTVATTPKTVTKQTTTKPVTTPQSYNDNAIAMAAYNASYAFEHEPNNEDVFGQVVYMWNDGNNQYSIGEGTADSTATITINGNNVIISFPIINAAVKKPSYDTRTFNINQLMNQQYHTEAQKNYINQMINDGYNHVNKLNEEPHPHPTN